MTKAKVVALVRCPDYNGDSVYHSIKTAIELLGGWALFLEPREQILLKPNMLKKARPEMAVTTHPAILEAVASLLQEAGYENLYYGDSPGSQSMESVADYSGLTEAAKKRGLKAADFANVQKVELEGISFNLCKGALEADSIINLPKMKTHALERITGALKNSYGCVGGFHKALGHTQYPDAKSFAHMLAQLGRVVVPKLHIMDGVVAMEGNGPGSGDPVAMGVILASADPYALDQVFCHLIGLDPDLVPTNAYASHENLIIRTSEGDISPEQVFSEYGKAGFKVDRSENLHFKVKAVDWLLQGLRQKPVIIQENCRSCRICVDTCPLEPKAIQMKGSYPVYDYKKCIRCYCCQEMCPHKAIDLHQPFLGKILAGSWRS